MMFSRWAQLRTNPQTAGARRSRRHRFAQRGVTLIEVMIVVVILGLISTGVAVAVLPKMKEASINTTKQSALQLRSAAEMWVGTNGGDKCPTAVLLQQEKAINASSKITDAWDQPFRISCDGEDITVSSPGPDKKDGTQDDIRVPDLQPQK